jgi:hypothetical protein
MKSVACCLVTTFGALGLFTPLMAALLLPGLLMVTPTYATDESRYDQSDEGNCVFYEGTYELTEKQVALKKTGAKRQDWSTEEAKQAFGTFDDRVNSALLKPVKKSACKENRHHLKKKNIRSEYAKNVTNYYDCLRDCAHNIDTEQRNDYLDMKSVPGNSSDHDKTLFDDAGSHRCSLSNPNAFLQIMMKQNLQCVDVCGRLRLRSHRGEAPPN